MALTSSLPVSCWYTDETSQWTLDYPPLFAWFERALALGAPLFDRGMLTLSALPHESTPTVMYQRLTVMATDVVLLLGSHALAKAGLPRDTAPPASTGGLSVEPGGSSTLAAVALCALHSGLLLVDHIHFQYNGFLLGLLLLSIAALRSGRDRWAALAFAALLNLKHLFVFAAPLYFVQLLSGHVLRTGGGCAPSRASAAASAAEPPSRLSALSRLAALGGIVVGVFGASLGPFVALGQLRALAGRIFPFGRGLIHAYWAPNAWAIYVLADRLGAAALRALSPGRAAGAADTGGTSGLVGETRMRLLPSVGGGHCLLLVLLLQGPLLVGTWRRPHRAAFAPAVAYSGLAAFCAGYHVHEKALLPPLLVLTCLAPRPGSAAARTHARLLAILSPVAVYSLLPLLHRPAEWALSRATLLAHLAALLGVLRARARSAGGGGGAGLGLRGWEVGYLLGFAPLELLVSAAHPLLIAPRLPFLPLMATSVYCALGTLHCTGLAWRLWRECRH